jgi:predicted DNA-binding transcriptional regulator AlpA
MAEHLAISAKHVADLLDVSTRQIWSMHQSGTLGPAPVKLSDRLARWDRSEVESWWQACREAGRNIGRQEWSRRASA